MRNRNAITRFIILLALLTTTLSVFVLPGAAESDKPSGEGCSPGYWKNLKKHEFEWNGIHDGVKWGYRVDDGFEGIFDVEATFMVAKFEDVIAMGGGGERALARHAVAALLNAANPGVEYRYSEEEVIAWVQWAYDDLGDFETVKKMFEDASEAGCPLN
jgi:hypothetical protein